MTCLGAVALFLAVVVMPESPKFLLINGRTEEAIASLNRIAWLNCAKSRIPSDAVFVETQIAGNLDHTLVLANQNESISRIIADTSRRAFGKREFRRGAS